MFLLTLLSGVIFVVPVFVTFGVYFGVEHQKILSCGLSCGHTGNSTIDDPKKLQATTFCQKSYSIAPPGSDFVFNPNQWGDPDDTGFLCINFQSSGYDTPQDYAPAFSATWQYPQGPVNSPVHAFANADLNLTTILPLQLSSMSGLTLDVEWTYNTGNDINADSSDYDALAAQNVNANVALDLFLASVAKDATSTTKSDYEVMVWLGRLGAYTQPLGFDNGSVETREVSGVSFDLFTGANDFGQQVLTWLAADNTTSFKGDVGSLVQDLDGFTGPSSSDYLGYVAFGTETLYSDTNTTLYVPKLGIDVLQG